MFAELCDFVEEIIQLYEREDKQLPPITSDYDWANTITGTIGFDVNDAERS